MEHDFTEHWKRRQRATSPLRDWIIDYAPEGTELGNLIDELLIPAWMRNVEPRLQGMESAGEDVTEFDFEADYKAFVKRAQVGVYSHADVSEVFWNMVDGLDA